MKPKTNYHRVLIIFSVIILLSFYQTRVCYSQKKVTVAEMTRVTRGFIGLGMVDFAEKGVNKMLEDDPSVKNDPEFYILLAMIYNHKKDFQNSSALLQKAAEMCT